MTHRCASSAVVLMLSLLPVWAGHDGKNGKAPLFPSQGRHHHAIATTNPDAQRYFDQGMTLMFGFNHAEAVRSFQRAAELDPKAAIAHWGMGLALGPNYNRDIDPVDAARNKAAYEAVERGLPLAKNGPPRELAYLKALAKRYSLDDKADKHQLEVDYMKAMGEVARAFPDDLDAKLLYAEAIVNLRPWKLWSPDGKPAEGTLEAVAAIEDVLRRDPDHIGANHYYIHALEASPYPERALISADRLGALIPWQGHLVHMPAHIYIHTGHYDRAAKVNEDAIKADEEYFQFNPAKGTYRMMYYHHNIHFLWYARMQQGRYEQARRAADKLYASIAADVKHMPMLEAFMLMPMFTDLRFQRWEKVLQAPLPDRSLKLSRAVWHYARALAASAQGMPQEAALQQKSFEAARKEFPADAQYMTNSVAKVLDVAAAVLEARLASDPAAAVAHWRKAVAFQDELAYGEPPDWYYPVRESLGAALLRAGQAKDAEAVFREDLQKTRRNGRALFGLMESLRAQKRDADADLVRLQFERVWKDGPALRLADL